MTTQVGIDAQDQDSPEPPLVRRFFTTAGQRPLDQIRWVKRDVWVGSKHEHLGVEAPDFWSDNAVAITSKLYLSKAEGSREHSVRQLVERVAAKITIEGMRHGYFGDVYDRGLFSFDEGGHARRLDVINYLMPDEPPLIFFDELCYVMAHQVAVFNSPVLFNVGRDDRPQIASACYLLDLEDTTDSIMRWVRDEAFIFKAGAGAGTNVSKLRGSMEELSTGGTASGPVSFMRLSNAGAETFKSGGTTRRAARLVVLDADHPDIRDFITCKVREEERVQALADAGFNVSMDEVGERNVAEMTSFQAANNSVSVTDEFMRKVLSPIPGDSGWPLVARKDGRVVVIDDAVELLDLIAQSAHACACPGLFFYDNVNTWHTTPGDGPIVNGNPCNEVNIPAKSSCNLASINVLKFVCDDGSFEVDSFRHVVDVMITAMDVLVQFCTSPNDEIIQRTRDYRWLGLGYANMGAAIMAQGLAYDSDAGRDFAASVTALMTGRAYRKSAELAHQLGPFSGFVDNREAMLRVIRKHASHVPGDGGDVWSAADMDWIEALASGSVYGYRNAQATVIAPTGTISFFMDCDTTGIEPAFQLMTHKSLAGGGTMTLVNQSVERGLVTLGYSEKMVGDLVAYVRACGCLPIDALQFKREHQDVFYGANEISAEGHIRMIAAIQPFLSGSSSKTINMSGDATWQDVRDAYVLAWRLGCKGLAIYRDGSKARQPHAAVKKDEPEHDLVIDESTGEELKVSAVSTFGFKGISMPESVIWPEGALERGAEADYVTPERRLLPRTRRSITHKIHLRGPMGDYKGYVHAGMYDDGRLAEIFIDGFGRAGSFTLNALGRWGTAFSKAIQYGIDWTDLARDSLHVVDETGGMVVPEPGQSGAPPIRSAKSVFDYIVRWLALEFGDDDLREEFGVRMPERRHSEDKSADGVRLDAADASWSTVTLHATTAIVGDQMIDLDELSGDVSGNAGYVKGTIKGVIRGPACPECGNHMRVTGGCFTCSCGNTSGCG